MMEVKVTSSYFTNHCDMQIETTDAQLSAANLVAEYGGAKLT
jgi:hypothetical protein